MGVGKSDGPYSSGPHGEFAVTFAYTQRDDRPGLTGAGQNSDNYLNFGESWFWTRYVLSDIQVTINNHLLREYVVQSEQKWNPATPSTDSHYRLNSRRRLTGITRYDRGGYTNDPSHALPSTGYAYTATDGTTTYDVNAPFNGLITQVTNGYGGQLNIAWINTLHPSGAIVWAMSSETSNGGVGNPAIQTSIGYTVPPDAPYDSCVVTDTTCYDANAGGFPYVTETLWGAGSTNVKVEHWFLHQAVTTCHGQTVPNNGLNNHQLLQAGHEYQTRTRTDPDGHMYTGPLLAWKEQAWDCNNDHTPGSGSAPGLGLMSFAFMSDSKEHVISATGADQGYRWSEYKYDWNRQPDNVYGQQWGNLTRILEYNLGTPSAPGSLYRTTERLYYSNPGYYANNNYILNRLAQETLYQGDQNNNLCREKTIYFYDDGWYTTPPRTAF